MKRLFSTSAAIALCAVALGGAAILTGGPCQLSNAFAGDKTLAAEVAPLKVGDAAPDFALKDWNDAEHKLSDLKGKIVVLEWTNPGCPFVVRHHTAGTMAKLQEKYQDKDVAFFAVNSTEAGHDNFLKPDAYKKLAEERKLTFPALYDADGTVGKAYGAKTTPHLFIVDKEGKVAYIGAMDDDPQGNSKEPKNYVDAALTALLDGKAPEPASTKPYGCSVKYAKK